MEPDQTTPTPVDEEPLRHLLLFVVAAAASAVVPFVVSTFTTGAANTVFWFVFCVVAAAIMGGVACAVRFGDWAFRRRQAHARGSKRLVSGAAHPVEGRRSP